MTVDEQLCVFFPFDRIKFLVQRYQVFLRDKILPRPWNVSLENNRGIVEIAN